MKNEKLSLACPSSSKYGFRNSKHMIFAQLMCDCYEFFVTIH
jgi:hypothetical protein